MKVIFATPTVSQPYPAYVEAMTASVPALEAAGIDHGLVFEIGCPYISGARATMLRKALDAKADAIVFLDHDLSWRPQDLVALCLHPAEVAAGLYRFKKDEEDPMGAWATHRDGRPVIRPDGCIEGTRIPAGFMKITTKGVKRFMRAYPELCYGPRKAPAVDLFNHGAFNRVWWGEDYRFSQRWLACGGKLAIIPDLDLTHHTEDRAFPFNLHDFLQRCPGGAKDPASNPRGLAQPQGPHG